MNRTETITLHIGHIVEVTVTPAIDNVIQRAKKVRRLGRTKVDVVRFMYPMLANERREVIWYSFIHGANLSSRGAVTYYYNVRREARMESKRKSRNTGI